MGQGHSTGWRKQRCKVYDLYMNWEHMYAGSEVTRGETPTITITGGRAEVEKFCDLEYPELDGNPKCVQH